MFSGVWKICQRRLYSCLSSKCGVPVCLAGLLLLGISALQFGEVLMEWSKDKYAVQFSIYADNIAGRSYESKLCPPMPIDVVYTWVNGSDQILLQNIAKLRQTLARKATPPPANITIPSSLPADPLSCPFSDCVPWRTLVLDATNITAHPLTLENIARVLPSLGRGAVKCTFINSSNGHLTPVYVVRMSHEDYVSSILSSGLFTSNGFVVLVTRGHLTSDPSLVGGIKMKTYHIALSDGIQPLNTSNRFRKWMVTHYGPEVLEAEIKTNRTAVVRLKSDRLESTVKVIPYQFFGANVTLKQAYLVWVPFADSSSKEDIKLERPDVVSASRFQDNEELRYSLRSVVQFAPWVRHIFIVTNGQIPAWLNLDNPRVTLVTHKEIFVNQSHLPTYSSPAIESHLHRIPGLANHFIYLNDDVMFGDYVWPEDFYTHQRGQKVYLSWPIPHCAEGCPPSWIRDRYCDSNCNNSACDWDGGDCDNASRPGPQGGHPGYHATSTDYCSPGCLNSWLGDRYCDSACRVPNCGYDAGDCGTEKWEELLGYTLSSHGPGGNFSLPLETAALFFNMSDLFSNGTISSAVFTPSKLIRTAIVAQKYKTLALTIARNVSITHSNFTLSGTSFGNNVTVTFSLFGDSVTKNMSKLLTKDSLSVAHSNTSSKEFLEAVVEKLASNKSINYWITQRPRQEPSLPPPPPPPPVHLTSYSVPNASLLPKDIAEALERLDTELKDGELTMKGYLKQKASLLKDHLHLVVVNGSVEFGGAGRQSDAEQARGLKEEDYPAPSDGQKDDSPAHSRKLLEFARKPPVLNWEESRRRLPWEKLRIFPVRFTKTTPTTSVKDPYEVSAFKSRKLMEEDMTDTFADSLRHVNRLYTKVYGHTARKVPSHMPHFIQKEVMVRLQGKFPEEYDVTSASVVRMADNMQFAFSYFYFLMGEKREMDIEDAYKELDTDNTNILSVRELRTLLAMISELPITMKDVEKLEDLLGSCDRMYNGTRPRVTNRDYELLYDSNLPLVTLDFTKHCPALIEKLNATIGTRLKYRFEEITDDVIAFKMISENSSEVAVMLDEIRKKRKKFICLNDNIDHSKEGAEVSKLILVDFYESLFPIPSSFEIPDQYRNRFLHMDELRGWMVFKDRMQVLLYTIFSILLLISIISLFYGKFVQWKRKLVRYVSSILPSVRTRL